MSISNVDHRGHTKAVVIYSSSEPL